MRRLNFITLGVRDLEKSKKFYQELFGWNSLPQSNDHISFFDLGGYVLALFPRQALAEDIGISAEGGGFSGVTHAHNVAEKQDVASFLEKAARLGAKVVKPAQDVFWGGHSGYFADPSGHLWEIAWNPGMPVKADGFLDLSV